MSYKSLYRVDVTSRKRVCRFACARSHILVPWQTRRPVESVQKTYRLSLRSCTVRQAYIAIIRSVALRYVASVGFCFSSRILLFVWLHHSLMFCLVYTESVGLNISITEIFIIVIIVTTYCVICYCLFGCKTRDFTLHGHVDEMQAKDSKYQFLCRKLQKRQYQFDVIHFKDQADTNKRICEN